jgi:hypothetical protein
VDRSRLTTSVTERSASIVGDGLRLQTGRVLSSIGRRMDGKEAVIPSLFNGTVNNADDVEVGIHHGRYGINVGSSEGVTGAT